MLRQLDAIVSLALETEGQLNTGGVIDRDFRSDSTVKALVSGIDVHILRCHEIENLFLQPEALRVVMNSLGVDENVNDVILRASDKYAGAWIYGYATLANERLGVNQKTAKQVTWALTWKSFESNPDVAIKSVTDAFVESDGDSSSKLMTAMKNGVTAYSNLRTTDKLWAECMGKQVVGEVADLIGLRGSDKLEVAVLKVLTEGGVVPSDILKQLRRYILSTGADS